MSEERAPILDFFVEGTPAPGGSKSAFIPRRKDGSIVCRAGTNQPVVNITDSGKGNKEWRKVVAWIAKVHMKTPPFAGVPIKCVFNFWMKRPLGEFNSKGELKPSARVHHISKPDALKLARSTEDALTGIVWQDDAQVVAQTATKQYCGPGEKPGCRIRITLL